MSSIEPSLTLRRRDTDTTITFAYETDRAGHNAPTDAIASITLDGGDTSWGEFMDRTALLAVHSWVERVLRHAQTSEGEGRR